MMINSKTVTLGLFGYPVKHSLSPAIHNYLFKKCNLNARYFCFEVAPRQLKEALQGAVALGCQGLNITIPHKEAVITYLDKVDATAKVVGAVNTVTISKGKLIGYNTDGDGFILSLKKARVSLKKKNVVILGAGGAAKAIGVYLAREGVRSITLFDIKGARAQALARTIKRAFSGVAVRVAKRVGDVCLKDTDLLVNATGVGLHKGDPSPIRLEGCTRSLLVYDLIYNPPCPALLKEAKRKKLRVMNGLSMLLYQALKADQIWWGKDFSRYAPELYRRLSKEVK